MEKKLLLSLGLASAILFAGCGTDAKMASDNLSKAADMFEIDRRVVFYNGISGEYILNIEGRCSISDSGRQLEVTCKTPNGFKKHFLGLSDNVTYFAEQLNSKNVSTLHYRVIFKPQSILPDVDFRGSTNQLINAIVPDNRD